MPENKLSQSQLAAELAGAARTDQEKAGERDSTGSRRAFLRGAGLGIAAVPVAMMLPSTAQAQGLGYGAREFRDIQRHENDHVTFLLFVLGEDARPRPTFKNLAQTNKDDFFRVAQTLENVGVGAYLGAAPAISDPANLAAAGSIALIEGRHAGFLNTFLNDPITENVFGAEQSFERPLTDEEVEDLASPFIASLNGGPPVLYTEGDDISILNFALALEYLEQEFYNINVPRFFPASKPKPKPKHRK